jgi:endonuclease/exonuclease/phosphatase family metal-dependent hydrolase
MAAKVAERPDCSHMTADDRAPGSWRILTWNVRGSHRPDLALVADVIREHAPDVLALQEIRRGQAAALARLLGWQHAWARKHHPYTPLAWWTSEGLAIASPHPLRDVVRRSISPGVSTWTFRHRIVVAATLDRPDGSLRLYDTHLAAHRQPDERIAQARRVADLVRAESPPLAVVAGDLNAPGEPEVIREFHPVGLRDPGGGPTNPSISPRSRLDYVLVPERSRVTLQWESAGGEWWWAISDHVPVVVEFTT